MGYSGAWGKLIHEKDQKSKFSWHCLFKGAQVWDFRLLGFSGFLHLKVSTGGRLCGVKYKFFNKIFKGPFGAAKFLTCMLSLILRSASLQNMLSKRIRNWCISSTYGSGTDAYAVHMHQQRKCTLSIYASVSYEFAQHKRKTPDLKRAFKTCASGTDACTEHAHQELMRALIVRAINWCACSACAS
jgi:hypothetical protein